MDGSNITISEKLLTVRCDAENYRWLIEFCKRFAERAAKEEVLCPEFEDIFEINMFLKH